jgi:hypothetical protein
VREELMTPTLALAPLAPPELHLKIFPDPLLRSLSSAAALRGRWWALVIGAGFGIKILIFLVKYADRCA